jgi:hypothetical protein
MVVEGRIPEGRLRRSRTDADIGGTLAGVLDSELTGYVVFEPQGSLLRGDDDRAVITFEAGVPVLAYHPPSDAGGTAALDALSGGPYHVETYALPADALAEAHRVEALRVPPGAPADRLANDSALVERTRAAAPDERLDAGSDAAAVEAFLADEERIEAIRADARAEAEKRAAEWGLTDQLEED